MQITDVLKKQNLLL